MNVSNTGRVYGHERRLFRFTPQLKYNPVVVMSAYPIPFDVMSKEPLTVNQPCVGRSLLVVSVTQPCVYHYITINLPKMALPYTDGVLTCT